MFKEAAAGDIEQAIAQIENIERGTLWQIGRIHTNIVLDLFGAAHTPFLRDLGLVHNGFDLLRNEFFAKAPIYSLVIPIHLFAGISCKMIGGTNAVGKGLGHAITVNRFFECRATFFHLLRKFLIGLTEWH